MSIKPSTPPSETREPSSAGRANQRLRTRQALVAAALDLSESGGSPTLEAVADKALVSRATAYRYFPSIEALMRDAYFERITAFVEHTVVLGDDPIDEIGKAVEDINRLLLQDEVGLHVVERSFMQIWLENATDDARRPRASRRVKFVDQILTELSGRLDKAARARLRTALTVVIGVEAVLSMRDVAGASIDETAEIGGWLARALVRQALADASPSPQRGGAPRPRKSLP